MRKPIRWQSAVLIVAVLVALFVLFATCSLRGSEARAAETTSTVLTFTAQAEPATPAQAAALDAAGTCKGTLWVWAQGWEVRNIFGNGAVAWAFGPRVYWCGNAGTVRQAGFSNQCRDLGGYYVFDGCSKSHSAFGYSRLSVYDVWRYHFSYKLWTDYRTPSVDFDLYPNGGVTGTVYYDN